MSSTPVANLFATLAQELLGSRAKDPAAAATYIRQYYRNYLEIIGALEEVLPGRILRVLLRGRVEDWRAASTGSSTTANYVRAGPA